MTSNLPKASAIRETLQNLPDLEAAMRGRVVKALIGGGLCRSLGFHINAADSKPIDVAAMDKAFVGKDVEQRARAKFALYQLGLIPA